MDSFFSGHFATGGKAAAWLAVSCLSFILHLAEGGLAGSCHAEVYYAQDEALKLAFPESDAIERLTFVVTEDQRPHIEKLAQAKLNSLVVTFYQGRKGGSVTGYAMIDSHTVRSQQETILVVLSPQGSVQKTVVLAFNEPPEYIASERWLEQFRGKDVGEIKVGDGIAGIVGSTLTTHAMADGVRRVLALFQVLVLKNERL